MTLKANNKSSKWHHLDINECYIEHTTSKSTLINMPSRSEYDGYSFWHPNTLVKHYIDGTTVLNFPDTWTFNLSANGDALREELSPAAFLDACDARDWWRFEKPCEKHIPLPMPAIEIEADKELIDDE